MLRSFILTIGCIAMAASAAAQPAAPRELDARRVAAAGVRVLEGRFVRLATDLPSSPAVDELPAVFDAAVPQWATYFGVPLERLAGRRWLVCLIDDRERFAALRLLPADNPEFINGYARDFELWLVEQPSDYYRRHLLLHEGTHAFMQTELGGAGPGWYMEGMAELLAAHKWQDGQLRLGVIPARREDVPMWGRTRIIRDAFAAKRAWPLEAVLKVDNRRALDTEHYAWTWALAALLDGHPQFRERFRSLQRHVADPAFSERFRKLFADDWNDLLVVWEAYAATLDYGYDVARMAMVHRAPVAVGDRTPAVKVDAERGWQSTGWLLRGGQSYRLTAAGRYQIAHDGRPWPCEPGGVTIEYHDGRPLGALLGALRPVDANASSGIDPLQRSTNPSFSQPAQIGLATTLRPTRDAVLYVRVNDSPAKLGDNAGELSLRVERADD